MDPKRLSMIYRVALEYKSRKTKKGPVKDGPYWFAYFMEDGKQKRIYIGKKLPKELQGVLASRSKAPGKRNYAWPGRVQAA